MALNLEQQPHCEADISTDLDIEINLSLENASFFLPLSDHSYCSIKSSKVCKVCVDKSNLIESLVSKINALTLTCQQLKHQKLFGSVKSSVFT